MRYFIPAWYSGQKLWKDNTLPFYYKPDKTDFDDMISLMSMHKKNGYEYKLLVLNYSPNLRLFYIDMIYLKVIIGLYLMCYKVLHTHYLELLIT